MEGTHIGVVGAGIMDMIGPDSLISKYRAAPLLREMVDGGRLGEKSGQGFHDCA